MFSLSSPSTTPRRASIVSAAARPSRRAVLGAGIATLVAPELASAATSSPPAASRVGIVPSAPQRDPGAALLTLKQRYGVPPAAAAAGMARLVLDENFATLSGFDVNGTGAPGYRWYTRAPWWQPSTRPENLDLGSDATSSSFLRISPSAANCNWNIATMDPRTGAGRSYRYGYFEARLRFMPVAAQNWAAGPPTDWPSFWSLAEPTVRDQANFAVEIDFFEALNGPTHFGSTMHHRPPDGAHYVNARSDHDLGSGWVTWQWHTYGCLWTPGRVSWYLDNRLLTTQTYGSRGLSPAAYDTRTWSTYGVPSSAFTPLDATRMVVALGTGPKHPMDIDRVRIFQA